MRNNLSQMISLSKVEEKLYRPVDAYELSRVTRMEHVKTTIVETPQEGIKAVATLHCPASSIITKSNIKLAVPNLRDEMLVEKITGNASESIFISSDFLVSKSVKSMFQKRKMIHCQTIERFFF